MSHGPTDELPPPPQDGVVARGRSSASSGRIVLAVCIASIVSLLLSGFASAAYWGYWFVKPAAHPLTHQITNVLQCMQMHAHQRHAPELATPPPRPGQSGPNMILGYPKTRDRLRLYWIAAERAELPTEWGAPSEEWMAALNASFLKEAVPQVEAKYNCEVGDFVGDAINGQLSDGREILVLFGSLARRPEDHCDYSPYAEMIFLRSASGGPWKLEHWQGWYDENGMDWLRFPNLFVATEAVLVIVALIILRAKSAACAAQG